MKYIIELKPEFEDSFKGLMILAAKDSDLFVDTLAVEDLEILNSDYINEHYGSLQDEAYQKGLNDAWEAAKKISLMTSDEIEKVFPGAAKYNRYNLGYSGVEAIEKLKAYEEKQEADSIKVGDEVYLKDEGINGDRGLILRIDKDKETCTVMWANDGSAGLWPVDEFAKTGRHFDIQSILEAMQYDSKD